MIPNPFRVGILTDNKVKDLKEQLKKVKYDAIIVGTDSDVEGNKVVCHIFCGNKDYPIICVLCFCSNWSSRYF